MDGLTVPGRQFPKGVGCHYMMQNWAHYCWGKFSCCALTVRNSPL